MGRWGWLRAVGAGALLGSFLVVGSVAAVSSAGVTIGETNNKYHFGPLTTYVNVGGTVTWKNGSDVRHTVTSDSGGTLASSPIGAGKTFSHTFSTVGTFAYHCTIHDYMRAKVIVLAAGVTPPPTDTLPASPADENQGIRLAVVLLAGLLGGAFSLRRFRRVS